MTQVVFSQRALVEASMRLASTSSERHGTYRNRPLAPGIERLADDSHRVDTRVHARPSTEAGQDRRTDGPTRCLCPVGGGGHIGNQHYPDCPLAEPVTGSRECWRCHGAGEVMFRHDCLDPQTEDSEPCRTCDGTGVLPVLRQVPGTRRAA